MDESRANIKLKNGNTLSIYQDMSAESPREWDNLSTMHCWHRNYNLGDVQNGDIGVDDLDVDAIVVPIYAYTKGGIRLATSPFSCPWDSGRLGFAVVTRREIIDNYGTYNDATIAQAKRCIDSEIKTYNNYLDGEVYGYVLKDSEGEEIDSCWGFYGYDPSTNGIFDQLDIGEEDCYLAGESA
jgi:hypothetical protein